jgi:hypothetical protein
MAEKSVRAHIVMPKALLDSIDEHVGRRERSKFLVEAAEEKLRRERQREAFEQFVGSLKDVDIPGWESHDSAVEWVRAQRRMGTDPWDESQRS